MEKTDGVPAQQTGTPEQSQDADIISSTSKPADLVKRFRALFAGLDTAYGTYIVGETRRDDGKLEGRAVTVRGAVTDALWRAHLDGTQGLGIIPIRADNTVVFGACDVDVYSGLDPGAVAATVARHKLPLVVCRSKSGGVHLYLFCKEPVPAAAIQSKLKELAALIGQGQCEIFPKQSRILVDHGDLGSWINAPFHNASSTTRYAVRPSDGCPLTPEEFLDFAEKSKVSREWISQRLPAATDALADGPPCLQHLIGCGFPQGTRNRGLFNLAVYARKASPDSWKDRVQELNQRHMEPPLAHDEVLTVIRSVDRKDYGYTCSESPLVAHCDRNTCRRRVHGVGRAGANALPVLGSLTQLLTTPPVWFLQVEQHRIELSTEALLNPVLFQCKCAEEGILVPLVKRSVWTEHLRPAMDSVHRIPVNDDDETGDDASSAKGHFLELLESFCVSRAQAHSLEETSFGKPYTEGNVTRFRLSALMRFLTFSGFKDLPRHRIVAILKEAGATNRQYKIQEKVARLWSVKAYGKERELPLPDALTEQTPRF